jgi:hypothetical protein
MRVLVLLLGLAMMVIANSNVQAEARSLPSSISPRELRVEFQNNPVGLDRATPRLSWKLQSGNSSAHNLRQTAYQILVASSAEALSRNQGEVWDSTRVESSLYHEVHFSGLNLESHKQYFWKVRIWDQEGRPSGWSAPGTWITGLMQPEDWKARWIASAPDAPIEPLARENQGKYSETGKPLPIFRHDFAIEKAVRLAVVYIAGLGQYELRLNGTDVSPAVLNPGWTEYRKTVLYNSYDVTRQLRKGVNSFAALLGNGMYNVQGTRGRYTKFIGSFGQPKLILQMHVVYSDGTEQTVVSDRSWKTTSGPVVYSSTYGGEDYDARKSPHGWDQPTFDDGEWAAAIEVNGPNGDAAPGAELKASAIPLIKVDRRFRPIRVTVLRPGVSVFDLGQNFSGWPVIKVRGHAGDLVKILPAELLDANGHVDQRSGGGNAEVATSFTYILNGDGIESWHPRFSYYGFRYVQVERIARDNGNGSRPELLSLEGVFVHDSAHADGSFTTTQPLLNRIHHLIDMAILSNMVSVMTDCPTREKLGWLEQTHLAATSIMANYNVVNLYEKMADDMRDSQLPNGLIPAIAPEYVAFVNRDGANTDFRDSPEWGSAVILSAWSAYEIYGDREILEDHYPEMQRYAEYLKARAKNGIVAYGLGDWYDIGPQPPGESQLTDKGVTATAIYYQDLASLSRIAKLLGRSADSKQYEDDALRVKDAFNQRYFHPDLERYDRGSQTANAMPLVLGMVPDAHRQGVLDSLVKDIRDHRNHVTAGDIGFHYVVRALTNNGRSDVLVDMLLRTDAPSYGDQLAKGATSLTEAWDSDPASSQNHFMLGHAEEWFYRGLVGIDVDLSRPDGEQIIIRPSILGNVPAAMARFDSVLGTIETRWSQTSQATNLQVQIPAGAKALVILPVRSGHSIFENGRAVSLEGLVKDGRMQLEVGSGSYHFSLQ